MLLVGLAQRELGQFFAKVARWANRLHKSDAKVNLFKKGCEFDAAQKFFEFFNEHRDAKRECSNARPAWGATTLTAERCCEQTTV